MSNVKKEHEDKNEHEQENPIKQEREFRYLAINKGNKSWGAIITGRTSFLNLGRVDMLIKYGL